MDVDVLPGGVMSAVQLHTLSVDLAASLTDTLTNPTPSTPRSWHAVTFPTYAAVRRTMTDAPPAAAAQVTPEAAVKSLPLRSLPPPPSSEARAHSWRSLDRPSARTNPPQRPLRARSRPRSARHHSATDASAPALPRPKPTRPPPAPAASFTSTASAAGSAHGMRRRFADRQDGSVADDNCLVRAANSMPARAFSARGARWDDGKRPGTAALNRSPRTSFTTSRHAAGMGRVPRYAGGDGEDCPAANAFAAERLVRTEGPQLFRRLELPRAGVGVGVASAGRADGRVDVRAYDGAALRRGPHGSAAQRNLQAPIAVKAKVSPSSSGIVASPTSSASSSRESSVGYGRLGMLPAVKTVQPKANANPSVADVIGDDAAPPLGLAGTLGKRGRFTHRLVQRHFVLEGTKLSNYRTREDVKPSWQRSIQGAHVITKERSHQIIIAMGKKRVILYAANGEDTRDWADALGRAAYGVSADGDARVFRYGGDVDTDCGTASAGDRSWSTRLHSAKVAADRAACTDSDWKRNYDTLKKEREHRVHTAVQTDLKTPRHAPLHSQSHRGGIVVTNGT